MLHIILMHKMLAASWLFLLIGLIVVLAIVLLTAKLQKHYKINIENPTEVELAQIEQTHKTKVISWIESFYEMVFSSTSVLIFLSLYYVLDERIPQAAYFWNKYQDILLMVFLVCSVFLTFWFDRIFVHLKTISSEQKSLRTTDLCLLYHSDLVVHKIYL